MLVPFLLLGACIKYVPVTPAFQLPKHQYQINAIGEFETRTQEGAEPHDAFSVSLNWEVDLEPVEQLRDDSSWLRLTVRSAVYELNDNPLSSRAEGKVIDFRIFPWGELLSVRYMDHLSGDGRWLDVFEPIIPSLFPNLPDLKKGESKQQELRWPIVEGETTLVRGANRITLQRLPDEGALRVFRYDGIWLSNERGPLAMQEGKVQGQVWLAEGEPWVIRHQFTWSRQILNTDSHQEQSQTFKGEVWRISP